MHRYATRAGFVLLGLFALCAPTAAQPADEERTFRKLTLDNGLRVVIASDPKINVSSASMAVGVGANADPEDAQGLAHFLEHMLFLANEKYPELNGYSKFLQAHGGMSNAYTSQDHTNYHFEVNHDGFPEALDRFAQFFVSPTLDWEYAQREVMAVNSEHQKNTMDDTWRLMQLQRSAVREDHPANAFSTGNKDTLKDAKEEVLRAFFNDYYKPPNMALSIVGNRSLDELEAMVRERFKGVKQGEAKPWTMPADLLPEAKGLRLFEVVPVKDLRQLRIFFDVPNQHPHALSKIENLVGMTMGDEGPGSLLSYLKQRGLATMLSAGGSGTRFYSSVQVTVGLTPKGLEQWREVLKLCFAYTRMLRESGFPKHVWEESKALAELNDRFGAKPEGTQAAIDLANNVLNYGLKVADKVNTTFEAPDPKAYQALVDALVPSNALVFLVSKGLETDKTETYYGTSYSYRVEDGENFSALEKVEVPEGIHVPKPNPFVPKTTKLLPVQPVLLIKDPGATIYFRQDAEFRRPKVALQMHILTPAAYGDAKQAALTGLYAAVIQEQLNEFSYPALMAGLSYTLNPTRQGLLLAISGYSSSAYKLLSIVTKSLRGELDAETFERVRLRAVEGVKNFPLGQAYQVVSELSRKVTLKRYYLQDELLETYKSAKLADVVAHRDALLAKTHIEGLGEGNLTGNQLRRVTHMVRKALGSEPFDPKQAHEDEVLLLQDKEEVMVKRVGATDQACLRLDLQVGKSSVQTRMAAELIGRALRNPFYTEMRTKQKLGYIVFSGTYNRENVQYLVFLIQSGTNQAPDLLQRADACIATLPEMFKGMPPQMFEALRQSLIQDRQKEPKTIGEQAGRDYVSAFEKEGDFEWLDKEIEALKALKQEDVAKLLASVVANKTRVTYLMAAKQHGEFKEPGTVGEDFSKFAEGRTYLKEKAGR